MHYRCGQTFSVLSSSRGSGALKLYLQFFISVVVMYISGESPVGQYGMCWNVGRVKEQQFAPFRSSCKLCSLFLVKHNAHTF